MITKEIKLNLWEENKVLIHAVQGEVDSRKIKVYFLDENDSVFNLSDKAVTFFAKKPDGTEIYNNCSIDSSGNFATLTFTSQMLNVFGIVECEFQIFSLENILLKANGLKIMVTSKGDFSKALQSTSEYNALTNALTQAQTSLKGLKINNNLIFPDSNNIVNISTSENNIATVEKGTWLPRLVCIDGTDPTYIAEYTFSHYYKIGNLVYITFFMHINMTDAGSGYAYIDGLPFVPILDTNRQAIAISAYGNLNTKTAFYVNQNKSYIKIGLLSGGSQSWTSNSNFYLGASGCYLKN